MTGKEESSEKVTRRQALTRAGAAAVAAAVIAGAGGYFAGGGGAQKMIEVTKTLTETVTQTQTGTQGPTTGDIVLKRAIDGINGLKSAGKIPPGTQIVIACEEGFQENAVSHAVNDYFYKETPFTRADFDIKVVGIPFANLYEKMSSEAVSKTGAYDVIWGVVTWFFPDLVEAGLQRNLEDYMAKYDPDFAMRNLLYGTLGTYLGKAKGKYYGIGADADVFLMHYRKDIMENPDEKDAFKSKYGYELKPPRTWDQFRDEVEFFSRKAGDKLAGQTLENEFNGFVEWRLKFVTYEWFWCRFCTLIDDVTKVYLDPDTLEPGISVYKDDAIRVLEYINDLNQFLPKGALGAWAYGEELAHFSNGNAMLWITWPNGGKIPQFAERSKIVGKVASTSHPIYKHERYYMASGYSTGVSNYSKSQELAYLVNQSLHSPTLAMRLVDIAESNVDPFETQMITDPGLRSGKWEDFTWDPTGASSYLDALYSSLLKGFPELAVPGNTKFGEAFETNIQQYFAGQISAEKCVTDTANSWKDIIDSVGKDRIKEYYSALITQMPP